MLEIKMSDFTSVALISNMTLLLFLLQPLSIINTKLTQYMNAKYIALSKLHVTCRGFNFKKTHQRHLLYFFGGAAKNRSSLMSSESLFSNSI